MVTATANDLVLATGEGEFEGPGVEHVQILATEGVKKVALTIAIKAVVDPTSTLVLFVEIQGSTDLANWHPLAGGDTMFDLSGGYANPDAIEGVAIDGWPWVRVRYFLRADEYASVSSVLLTAVLSAAG